MTDTLSVHLDSVAARERAKGNGELARLLEHAVDRIKKLEKENILLRVEAALNR